MNKLFLAHVRSGFESHGCIEVRCLIVRSETLEGARAYLSGLGLIVEHVEEIVDAVPL